MKPPLGVAVATLAFGALAACAPAPKDTPITAADLPHVRVGLWEEISGTDRVPQGWSRDCSDGQLHLPTALMPRGCATQPAMKRTPAGAIEIAWACTGTDGVTVALHTTVSGDFNSSYAIDSTTSMHGGGAPPQVTALKDTYRFIGACPADITSGPDLPYTE
jgi:hypothetical protein